MNDALYPVAALGVVAAVTWFLRAFPFVLFGRRALPGSIRYLGRALPPAIMSILVLYCLRGTDFGQFPYGAPELVSCAVVVLLQTVRNNMYLSILAGTVCYMALLRLL